MHARDIYRYNRPMKKLRWVNINGGRATAMVMIIASSVIISFGGLIVRSMESAGPWQINFYRPMALLCVIGGYIAVRFGRESFAVIMRIGALGALGGVFLGVAGMTYMHALTRTTVANTLFILGAIPFITALLARIFLGERLSRATVLTMSAGAVGLGVMVVEGIAFDAYIGNALALLTAVMFACYAVIVRARRQREMLPTLLISALVLMPVSAIAQGGALHISMHDLLLCFLFGGVLGAFGHTLFIYASRHLAAAEITLFMLLEFALGPLWVWLAINEQPSPLAIIGGCLIICAVATRAALELIGGKPSASRFGGPV